MTIHSIETRVFTRRLQALGLEPALRDLQAALSIAPESGDLDPGTGGLRKVRVPDSTRGKGKRSGARVHYLHLPRHSVIYLLFIYGKDDTQTLTPAQKAALREVVTDIKAEWRQRDPIVPR